MRLGAGGTLPVDYVAVHPYGQRAPDDWPSSSWGFGNMSTLLNNCIAFGKPLWISEIGDNSGNQAFTSDYLANVYNLITSRYASSVLEVFWFCWSDGMVANFGIVDAAGNPKQQYSRYQSLAGSW